MTHYEAALRRELSHARRLMMLNYGKPAHATYRQMARLIEAEIRALTVRETASA